MSIHQGFCKLSADLTLICSCGIGHIFAHRFFDFAIAIETIAVNQLCTTSDRTSENTLLQGRKFFYPSFEIVFWSCTVINHLCTLANFLRESWIGSITDHKFHALRQILPIAATCHSYLLTLCNKLLCDRLT